MKARGTKVVVEWALRSTDREAEKMANDDSRRHWTWEERRSKSSVVRGHAENC